MVFVQGDSQAIPAESGEHPAADPLEGGPGRGVDDGNPEAIGGAGEQSRKPGLRRCFFGAGRVEGAPRPARGGGYGCPDCGIEAEVEGDDGPADEGNFSDPVEVGEKESGTRSPSANGGGENALRAAMGKE